ncbi:MAG: glycosyltransferase family 2 protein [Fimbriimonadales bacterium]
MVPLALAHRRAAQRSVWSPDFAPKVGVAIAAYNEERVVVATVQSVLASTYPVAEVVVVDDRSSDGTSAVLLGAFAGRAAVRVSGKRTAVRRPPSTTPFIMDSRIVVSIDADTQFDPEAVGKLVRHFEPTVAAVAGSVEVGNLDTMVTQWQSVEYTTSQNLDRQAYAVLNAITVVPGAIGAWRRTAVQEVGGSPKRHPCRGHGPPWRLGKPTTAWRPRPTRSPAPRRPTPSARSAAVPLGIRHLQCLWKHRRALGKHGFAGKLALPLRGFFGRLPNPGSRLVISIAFSRHVPRLG